MLMLDTAANNLPACDKEHESIADRSLLPLQTIDLSLQVNGHRLINHINLTLSSTQFSVVMGANGAGKTILLRLLHGLQEPTSGQILWGGLPMDKTVRIRQAMVFQKSILLRRSVSANIDFVLGLHGRNNSELRDRILDQVDLLGRARQPARLLSGGEQQRLALARALATEPEVLFLDEPTASLDPASVLKIESVVSGAHKRGIKIIFVTHDLGQARRLAEEVIFLHHGCLKEHSSAEQFFSNPSSTAANAYIEGRIML